MNKNPVCFGNFPKGDNPCAKCEFFDSCRYFAATSRQVGSRSRLCSYDANSYRIAEPVDYDHIPGEEDHDLKSELISMLSRFFRYLLGLDEYTIGLIGEIVSPEHDGGCNVNILSRLHRCSRQAIHRKILSVIARNPELSGLFQSVMPKLAAGRRSFLRHRAAGAAGELEK